MHTDHTKHHDLMLMLMSLFLADVDAVSLCAVSAWGTAGALLRHPALEAQMYAANTLHSKVRKACTYIHAHRNSDMTEARLKQDSSMIEACSQYFWCAMCMYLHLNV